MSYWLTKPKENLGNHSNVAISFVSIEIRQHINNINQLALILFVQFQRKYSRHSFKSFVNRKPPKGIGSGNGDCSAIYRKVLLLSEGRPIRTLNRKESN